MRTIDQTAAAVLSPPKGMLVADEYAESLLPGAAELALNTPELSDYVSAVLLTEEAFTAVRTSSPDAPLTGIRADPVRLPVQDHAFTETAAQGNAAFVEWRAHVSPLDVPSGSVHVDVDRLAAGAAATQAAGLLAVLSIAMPELGASSITVSQAATTNALLALRDSLAEAGVDPERLLIRVNMVVPGSSYDASIAPDHVASLTVQMLERALPEGIPGILLLSGGQTLETACANLQAISALTNARQAPWQVTFGFSRALFAAAGRSGDNVETVRTQLLHDARLASAAVAASPPSEPVGI